MRVIPKKEKMRTAHNLIEYLEATKEVHNGFGGYEFVAMVEAKVDKANLAKAMHVSRTTIYVWLEILETK